VVACKAAEVKCPDYADAFALRGLAQVHLQDYKEAAQALDRYLELKGPPLADVYRGRGQARMQLARFREAGEDYSRALELITGTAESGAQRARAELLTHHGWALFFSNAFELALEDFDGARQLLPRGGDAFIGSGLCKAMLGRYREAVTDADVALRLQVKTPEMMFNVACIFSLASGRVRADTAEARRLDLEAEYRTQAAVRIRSALQMLPAPQRCGYWQTKMRGDKWLDPIRASAEFVRLEKDYAAPPPKRPSVQQKVSGEKTVRRCSL
jgi:tetratricopeptide (TPR) repeat protein